MSVGGKTAVCFTLAHPVSHVRTPAAFNALAAERGLDAVMIPLEIAPSELAGFLASMRQLSNVTGAVITIPHKTEAARLCDELSARAAQCGAVNVIRRTTDGRLLGGMFDGLGFVEGLRRAGYTIEGRSVLLAGAGGAASAIAFALAEAGVARLVVCNRTERRACELAVRLGAAFPAAAFAAGLANPSGFDLIVNATSLGLKAGDPLPVDGAGLSADMLVADIIMQPERTALLEKAAEAGARTHSGRAMLEAQLDLIVDFLSPSAMVRRSARDTIRRD